jgi:hypothetical protein
MRLSYFELTLFFTSRSIARLHAMFQNLQSLAAAVDYGTITNCRYDSAAMNITGKLLQGELKWICHDL